MDENGLASPRSDIRSEPLPGQSSDIKERAVKSRHIAPSGVGTSDLGDGAVTRAKLAPQARTNVIEYKLGPHNFTSDHEVCVDLGLPRSVVRASVWTAQLDDSFDALNPTLDDITYSVPGGGEYGASQYRIYVQASDAHSFACVTRQSGPGEEYDAVRIIRTLPTERKQGVEWEVPGR